MFQCREQYKDIPHLLVAGINTQDWVTSDTKIRIEELGLSSHIHLCGMLSKDLLIGLTKKAHTLCYPSLYEGFGFPVLEAMACGTPVVCSQSSSLPEIAGDAAITVPATDDVQLATAVERVLTDPGLCAEMRRQGLRRAGQFSWRTCANHTADLYTELVAAG